MHITHARSFRCFYRRAVPGRPPVELFVQLRARHADAAENAARAVTGSDIERVEPAPHPAAMET